MSCAGLVISHWLVSIERALGEWGIVKPFSGLHCSLASVAVTSWAPLVKYVHSSYWRWMGSWGILLTSKHGVTRSCEPEHFRRVCSHRTARRGGIISNYAETVTSMILPIQVGKYEPPKLPSFIKQRLMLFLGPLALWESNGSYRSSSQTQMQCLPFSHAASGLHFPTEAHSGISGCESWL